MVVEPFAFAIIKPLLSTDATSGLDDEYTYAIIVEESAVLAGNVISSPTTISKVVLSNVINSCLGGTTGGY
jgi:hypothetical protein